MKSRLLHFLSPLVAAAFLAAGAAATTSSTSASRPIDAFHRALRWYPEFLDNAGRRQPATNFLKSASYLLHDEQLSRTRELLLKRTEVIVHDDTGIRYRHLAAPGSGVKLFVVSGPATSYAFRT